MQSTLLIFHILLFAFISSHFWGFLGSATRLHVFAI